MVKEGSAVKYLQLKDLCLFRGGVEEKNRNSIFEAPLDTRIHGFLEPPLFILLPDLGHCLEMGVHLWC